MQLKRIHHVAIIVSNYEVSKQFYTQTLGLPILRENIRADRGDVKLDLQLGDAELELFGMKNPPARLSYPEACGLRHLAFQVDDIDAVIAELNSKGVKTQPVRTDPYTGCRAAFFHDPDGLPLELYERRANR